MLKIEILIHYAEKPDWEKEIPATSRIGCTPFPSLIFGQSINRSIEALALQGQIYVIAFLESMMAEVTLFFMASYDLGIDNFSKANFYIKKADIPM
ncbi:hypothetical protein V7266_18265 [Neobacillus drentensis]|uniref:hypothetical protein n=1 Tax=Neobacillus drentensis TaxID=220684 RepID=UPI00300074C2